MSGDKSISYKTLDYVNICKSGKNKFKLPEKLIVTYSEKCARKERGVKKYLKEQEENIDWMLDAEAIARDEKFDGYYGIQTGDANLSVEKILNAYHTLWKIEESFRIMKST